MKKSVIEFMLEQLGGEERVMELYHAAQPPHELDDACTQVLQLLTENKGKLYRKYTVRKALPELKGNKVYRALRRLVRLEMINEMSSFSPEYWVHNPDIYGGVEGAKKRKAQALQRKRDEKEHLRKALNNIGTGIVFRPQEYGSKELAPGVTTRHWSDFPSPEPKEKTQ